MGVKAGVTAPHFRLAEKTCRGAVLLARFVPVPRHGAFARCVVKKEKIAIVGCGPGSLDYLTPLARNFIHAAEVIAGTKRLLDLFQEQKAEKIFAEKNIEKFLNEISACWTQKKIAVLVTGDPGLCSLGQCVIKRFGIHSCQVIPGVSSVQVAFARIGIDWLNVKIVNAHEKEPEIKFSSLARNEKIAVLAGSKTSLFWIKEGIKNLEKTHQAFLCENLTLENEKVRLVTFKEIAKNQVSSRTIFLMIKRGLLL